ncbi:MAG: hypothetical protein H7Z43_02170 [Clostridia bacterium]|nr:hypothetical protein [Deltaproteobacteria bacterium]
MKVFFYVKLTSCWTEIACRAHGRPQAHLTFVSTQTFANYTASYEFACIDIGRVDKTRYTDQSFNRRHGNNPACGSELRDRDRYARLSLKALRSAIHLTPLSFSAGIVGD